MKYKLLPEKATNAMRSAGRQASFSASTHQDWGPVYKAMWEAAPGPVTEDQDKLPNPWRDAIEDVAIGNWSFDPTLSPRDAVAAAIRTSVDFALDPLISDQALALVDRGRIEAEVGKPTLAECMAPADAKLIAAAPDLLKACAATLAGYPGWQKMIEAAYNKATNAPPQAP